MQNYLPKNHTEIYQFTYDFPKGSYYYADTPCIIQKDGISFSQKCFSPFYIEDEELSSKKPHGNISIHV